MIGIGIIVDGYSSGAGLPSKFKKLGYECIHVCSHPEIPKVYRYTFNSQDYIKSIPYVSDTNSLVKELAKYKPAFVIAGAEPGVEYADLLANLLHMHNVNDISLSKARRNKVAMADQLKVRGLRHIPTYEVCDVEMAVNWVSTNKGWPYVVKPVNSAGGDQVKFCNTSGEVSNAVASILSNEFNMLGYPNNTALVQPYCSGREVVINTASCNGQHYICEVWEYERCHLESGEHVYQRANLVSHEIITDEIKEYVYQVNDALGVRFGAAHSENIISDTGPVLVELGARLMGANLPSDLIANCVPHAQADMVVKSLVDQAAFESAIEDDYRLAANFTAVFMASPVDGVLKGYNHLSTIAGLPSFAGIKLAKEPGDKVCKTIDYATCPGMIYLAHEDQSVIEHDYNLIRELEGIDLYDVHQEVKEIEQ